MKLLFENWRRYNKINLFVENIDKRNLSIVKGPFLKKMSMLQIVQEHPEQLNIISEDVEGYYNSAKIIVGGKQAFKILEDRLNYLLRENEEELDEKEPEEDVESFDPFGTARADIETTYQEEVGELPDEFESEEERDKSCLLTFSRGNSKLKTLRSITLSLPAGYSCPFAGDCKTRAEPTGELTAKGFTQRKAVRAKHAKFNCFAANQEAQYPQTAKARWRNFDLLRGKSKEEMIRLIQKSLDFFGDDWQLFRFHDAGDFFNQDYFDAWLEIVKSRPGKFFYGYTTALPFWVARLEEIKEIPNINFIASRATRKKDLIKKFNLRYSQVYNSVEEAVRDKMDIDVNEYIAAFGDEPFALLLHNTQQPTKELGKKAYANQKEIKKAAKEQLDLLHPKVIRKKLAKAKAGIRLRRRRPSSRRGIEEI